MSIRDIEAVPQPFLVKSGMPANTSEEGFEGTFQVHERALQTRSANFQCPGRPFLLPQRDQTISAALLTGFVELIPLGQTPVVSIPGSTGRFCQHDSLVLIGFQLDFMSSLNHFKFLCIIIPDSNIACTLTISSVNLRIYVDFVRPRGSCSNRIATPARLIWMVSPGLPSGFPEARVILSGSFRTQEHFGPA